jgi:hypothetical protein
MLKQNMHNIKKARFCQLGSSFLFYPATLFRLGYHNDTK